MIALRSLPAAVAAALMLAPAAHAADYTVTSFDGTPITAHWFPLAGGSPAPTVLMGPGWGGTGDVNEAPGGPIARFRGAGYSLLTDSKWNSIRKVSKLNGAEPAG